MKGRPPVPTTLKIVRGNPGRRALNVDEPSSPALKRMPPAAAMLDPIGRKAWYTIGPRLIRANLLNERFLESFANYCVNYQVRAKAMEDVNKRGPTLHGQRGSYINPSWNAVSMCIKQMESIIAEFGGNPAANSKVKSLNPRQRNLFGDFLDGVDEQPSGEVNVMIQ